MTGRNFKRRRQGGAVVIVLALSLVVLFGFLALALDLGRLYIVKTELQNAADAAALAGAKELDGSITGIDNALSWAKAAASRNTFFGNTGHEAVTIEDADVQFSSVPTGPWENAGTAKGSPSGKFFVKVDTASGNLQTWFAPAFAPASGIGIMQTSTFGMAVAGRFPPGALSPMFIPAMRRNIGQVGNDSTYPYCSGVIYDPKDKNLQKNTCPYDGPFDATGKNLVEYRVPDDTLNWGLLKPGESKTFGPYNSHPDGVTEKPGSYYVITPTPNNSGNFTQWAVGTSWTGNFGFMLKSADQATLKSIAAALCTGGGMSSYSVPGCGAVHPGNLSGPKIADNINTRFDMQGNQTQLPHSACPSDTNVWTDSWPASGVVPAGLYTRYLAGVPPWLLPPTNFPPGVANRRLINVYVVDNAWLSGYDIPTSPQDNSCLDSLQGGSQDAHLVGCAQFFAWKPADGSGKLYAEFVQRLPDSQCMSTIASSSRIRLYQ